MIPAPAVLAAALGYLMILFVVASYADRRAAQGRSVIGNGWIYGLSWAVYCSAWTYFGSIGTAAASGVWFLPIYLGPTLAMVLGWIVIRRMAMIARSYRITSIADFLSSRYGKSRLLAALVTLITVVGLLPYIALQLKAVSGGFHLLTAGPGPAPPAAWWRDGTLAVALALAAFTVIFGTRHLDVFERHEGMVAAIAFESVVKLVAFLAIGVFVTWSLFDGPADIWARAATQPELRDLMRLAAPGAAPDHARWFTLTALSALSVLVLPRMFQVMVVECTDPGHVARASWLFPAYLLAINLFVLPIALGGRLLLGPGVDAEGFVLSLPLAHGAPWLALLAYLGGLSAATGMLIVETIAISTMVCNDLVMPALLSRPGFGRRAGGDLTGLLLAIRRAAILGLLLLGYLYFRLAGEAYALVSIGLVSFAAVAQFAPALLAGLYWRGATTVGAIAGLVGGFALWLWTLLLPAIARSGWIDADFLTHGPFGLTLLAPERLFGLSGLDPLSHSLFWSLLLNTALLAGLSLARDPGPREASQALLFATAGATPPGSAQPVFWRGRARIADLADLARRLLGADRAAPLFAGTDGTTADPQLVDRVERQLAGAVGAASARLLVASAVEEEPLTLDGVFEILAEASQLRGYARALEEKSLSLERATAELRAANEELKSLDQLKDDFMSSVTHELRTPLTSIRALSELMQDNPDMAAAERDEFLTIVVSESERLSRLVNQVLDMAKIESGRADWRAVEVDMGALITAAARATGELFRSRGAMVDLRLPDTVPPLNADPDRLTQVLLNLLSNAAKFVPEGSGRVTVSLEVGPVGLTITVADNGPGIAPEDQARIFEKFRQGGEAAGRPPGTGLGLPISRRIVDHFGGRMWLDSAPGQGARFFVWLPIRPAEEDGK